MIILETSIFGNMILDYLVAVAVVILSYVFSLSISTLVKRKIIDRSGDTSTEIDDVVAILGPKPIFWVLFLLGLYFAVCTIKLPSSVDARVWQIFVVAWGIVGAAFTIRLVNGVLAVYFKNKEQGDERLYAQIMRIGRSFVAVLVWIVAAVFIISNLGFDISAILASLGIGGLAFALALKDTLSNIFGSITILVNGPFRLGEAVSYEGHEGVVEEIGIRDTRIRTWAGHLVIVPNSKAPTSIIENISRRPSFRVLFKLSFDFKTPAEKIEEARQIIADAINEDERVKDKAMIHFLEFGDSAMQFQVIYYIKDPGQALNTRHDINTKISTGLASAQIPITYPTISVQQAHG